MQHYADIVVLLCLFNSGIFFGYYCKYAYIYENLWSHWHAVVGVLTTLLLGGFYTLKKYKQQQYKFDHFYIIFYGLMCHVMSSCLMITNNMKLCFYFGFLGLATNYMPCMSFINLHSKADGTRPARIALGYFSFYAGLTAGFQLFNLFEAQRCGWIYFGINACVIACVMVNECLQHFSVHDYKQSYDLAFNLMNEEKMVFMGSKAVYSMFVERNEFYFTKNRQWLVVGLASLLVVDGVFLYSPTYLQLVRSSTAAYMGRQFLYTPFLAYTVGCLLGMLLLLRYMPKFVYLLFGLIKVTLSTVILSIYDEDHTERCFIFLCFYYLTQGVYASTALQMLLECTPLLYTELGVSVAFGLQLVLVEVLKYEAKADASWGIILGIGLTTMLLTIASIVVVQLFLPNSAGLIEIRNKLIGIQRHQTATPELHSKIWHANGFMPHHEQLQQFEFTDVKLDGHRVFQQYPPQTPTARRSVLPKLRF